MRADWHTTRALTAKDEDDARKLFALWATDVDKSRRFCPLGQLGKRLGWIIPDGTGIGPYGPEAIEVKRRPSDLRRFTKAPLYLMVFTRSWLFLMDECAGDALDECLLHIKYERDLVGWGVIVVNDDGPRVERWPSVMRPTGRRLLSASAETESCNNCELIDSGQCAGSPAAGSLCSDWRLTSNHALRLEEPTTYAHGGRGTRRNDKVYSESLPVAQAPTRPNRYRIATDHPTKAPGALCGVPACCEDGGCSALIGGAGSGD